ncbi:MAG: TonB family protein, partial [Xanthomonadales bacterium]|nr:TonB family protein [Xanthomonadales bacterium]
LSVTTVFAILVHAVIVLGVGFEYEDLMDPENLPALDVILVQRQTEEEPEEADFLAQASQQGGGTAVEKVRPQAPLVSQVPKPDPGEAPQPVRRSVPEPTPQTPPEVLTRDQAVAKVQVEPERELQPEEPTVTDKQLIERSMEIARLEAEIGRDLEAYAKRPRRKFISANTREYAYAAYMQAWVAKVERLGNLNYPDEARRRRLSGSLVLSVGIKRTGEIDSIEVIQPSGFKILDEAAIRIVRMGSPYSPLPENIRDKVDILHITRTWQFLPGNSFGYK